MDIYIVVLITSFNIINVLSIMQDVFFKMKNKNKLPSLKKTHDILPFNTVIVVILTFMFFLIIPLNFIFDFLPKLINWPRNYYALSLGISMSFLGVLVRFLATRTLSKAHSVKIQIRENQKLHQNGLYRLIRHPIYLGLFLTVSGISLMFQDTFMLSIAFPIYFYFIFTRLKAEEKILINHFGKDYLVYMKNTNALIPFIY